MKNRHYATDFLRRSDLEARQRAAAREIALGALRHLITIECVLGHVARYQARRTPLELRAVLYCAAYQMIWMQHEPPFAVVHDSVELANARKGARARGMVNAILRRLADAVGPLAASWQPGDSTQIRTDWNAARSMKTSVLPPAQSTDEHVAAAAGERRERFRHLQREHADQAADISWASQARPVIVIQRLRSRISHEAFVAALHSEFADQALAHPDVAYTAPSANIADSALLKSGVAYVQDQTARAAAGLLAVSPGENVLDYCAAPGGKTVAMADAMQGTGRLIAHDVDPARFNALRQNLQHLHFPPVECVEPGHIDNSNDRFDAVMLDVPCSNSGVISRRPEARFRLTADNFAALAQIQFELLQKVARHVRPGGRLVYSTCSIDRVENDNVVQQFLAQQSRWTLAAIHQTLPHWGPGLADWRDGGFAALLHHGA